ncbi:CbiX/SirB N-terminal domain-containing protein [Arthrobacter sp. Br18]|uniref:sirohydrochlorin chelatase n=1 Tax=Arthrobacter sp. Br18 TaxID=1312954 RepID=UPI00047E3433|nr:CbiX/SirB N-terminal domain-containing protein [Arthrobacter sp. Br18]
MPLTPDAPVFIACSHGTDNPRGRAEINRLRDQIQEMRPGLEICEAYVDVQEPALPDVVRAIPAGRGAVIVPLLLSVGYHVKVDIAHAAASRPGTIAALPLGPDPRLAGLLQVRLTEAGVGADASVVLAAAGSSDACAAVDVAELREDLVALRPGPMRAGFGSAAKPSVTEAVAQARAGDDGAISVASYLLAPGYFHDQLARAGADIVSAPLLPSPLVAAIALDRYDAVLRAAAEPATGECPRPCRPLVSECVRFPMPAGAG